jgi:hypothetical protein
MKPKSNATHSFDDKAGRATVGFCLWCNQNFYTSQEISVHNGDGAEGCPVFSKFLSEQGAAHRPTNRKGRKRWSMKRNSELKTGGKMDPEPMVGIFWLFKGELIFDVTPVSAAEPYGDCVGHAKSHIAFWSELQHARAIPWDVEYEDPPRGRVIFNLKTKKFNVYSDKCIRVQSAVVRKIFRDFSLPSDSAVISRDGHYRCRTCLSQDATQEF